MSGTVPLGRRNLLADRRRLAASVAGVGLAVEQGDNPHLQTGGRTWWFCSTRCRDEFAAHPDRFPLVPERAVS